MLKLGRRRGSHCCGHAGWITGMRVLAQKSKTIHNGQWECGQRTGVENAGKLLHFEGADHYLDASDALAVAVCHYFQQKRYYPELWARSGTGKTSSPVTRAV